MNWRRATMKDLLRDIRTLIDEVVDDEGLDNDIVIDRLAALGPRVNAALSTPELRVRLSLEDPSGTEAKLAADYQREPRSLILLKVPEGVAVEVIDFRGLSCDQVDPRFLHGDDKTKRKHVCYIEYSHGTLYPTTSPPK